MTGSSNKNLACCNALPLRWFPHTHTCSTLIYRCKRFCKMRAIWWAIFSHGSVVLRRCSVRAKQWSDLHFVSSMQSSLALFRCKSRHVLSSLHGRGENRVDVGTITIPLESWSSQSWVPRISSFSILIESLSAELSFDLLCMHRKDGLPASTCWRSPFSQWSYKTTSNDLSTTSLVIIDFLHEIRQDDT